MKLEYIVFRYSCEYKTLSRLHVSPYLILTFGRLIKMSKVLPMKRLTKRKIDLLTTAEESLYPTFWEVLRAETREDRFQRLYEILRGYTMVEDFGIIYYHEVYSRSV